MTNSSIPRINRTKVGRGQRGQVHMTPIYGVIWTCPLCPRKRLMNLKVGKK